MLRPDALSWPGPDRARAVAACFHLERAVQVLLYSLDRQAVRTTWRRKQVLQTALVHLSIAQGFLGDVGLERRRRARA